jgi:hypothetical protein
MLTLATRRNNSRAHCISASRDIAHERKLRLLEDPVGVLYGSEIWCLREDLFNRLRHFHHRCARTTCRIAIAHTIRHRISSASLFKRLSIESFDTCYNRRLLRWTEHAARMPLTRASRKCSTSWVDNPRPLGCPQMK